MAKKKTQVRVLNDFNDIVALMEENQKKANLERKIIASILGVALGLTVCILYLTMKGN